MTTHDIDKALEKLKCSQDTCLTSMPPKFVRNTLLSEEEYESILFALKFTKAALGEPSDSMLDAAEELEWLYQLPKFEFKAMIAQIVKEVDSK